MAGWCSHCYSFHHFVFTLLFLLLHWILVNIALILSSIIFHYLAVSFVADRSLTGDGFVAVMPKLTGSLVLERTGTLSTISLTLLFTLVHHARED